MDDVIEPVVAPVTTPVPEVPVVETVPVVEAPLTLETAPKVETPEPEVFTYLETGDAGLDIALEFLGKAGFGIDHPAVQAARDKGDFSVLEAFLKDKNVPGWEKHLAVGKEAFQRATAAAEVRATANRALVYETVGGAEAWTEIQAWASANADDAEKAQVNYAFEQGGLMAKAMAQFLQGQHREAAGVTVRPTNPIKANAKPSGAPTTGPLNRAEYATAVQALRQKFGPGFETGTEYRQLQQRHLASKR